MSFTQVLLVWEEKMSFTQVLLVCLGFCLLGKQADAQPALTQTTITSPENPSAISNVGSVTVGGTPVSVSVLSEPNDGQFTVLVSGGTSIIFVLTTGFMLDYETDTSYVVVLQMVDGSSATGTGTVTITVTDVVEEFAATYITVCLSGLAYAAGAVLTTQPASLTTVAATYTLSSQTPNVGHLMMDSTTGAISVASGKTLNGTVVPVYTASISLTSSSPAVTTSTAVVTFTFVCSSSSDVEQTPYLVYTLMLIAIITTTP